MSDTKYDRRNLTRDALEYHSKPIPGKTEVVPTKPTSSQRDLSLAYSPGVAAPCLEIEKDPSTAYQYTNRGNLVAVISNGTAVLGLGDIGALAGKPVMEGKGVLFKRFAGIDVFDLEVEATDVDEFVNAVKVLEPTFGGINLEDISAPSCFEIEKRLQEAMNIPVFHDDQHGTAIISAAALVNALEIAGKKIDEVRLVVSGAGASAIACVRLYIDFGVKKENVMLVDSKGIVWEGRTEGMNDHKREFAVKTDKRSLADAMEGADVFVGLSVAGLVSKEMVESMAENPIVFAMANPDPEITPEDAFEARKDVIMATGRSDYPNQVNNVLGFPFIFRGALDCRATAVNEEMKQAAAQALADLAKEDVPDSVLRAYSIDRLEFGPEYLIPKPFDWRVLLRVPPAVAKAAADSGVAKEPIEDYDQYVRELERFLGRSRRIMTTVFDRIRGSNKTIVFPEGDDEKIVKAAKIVLEEEIGNPILLGPKEKIEAILQDVDVDPERLTIIDPENAEHREAYTERLHDLRRREGVTLTDAKKLISQRNYFAMMMLDQNEADGVISGLRSYYPTTIRPALEILKTKPGVRRVSGAYLLMLEGRELFLADTTVNIEPTAEDLAEIARLTAETATQFGMEPRVAMLSFSNFGSTEHPLQTKVKKAVEILRETDPDLVVDGEMQADTAVVAEIAAGDYPWSAIQGDA
ncbi:MAG: NADP-dependent malic enzyme, partial [Thermoanaerobaculia bacterium]|nr:NADP-dependent malic enzyme [Thermoanaerobaculia bacterium]